MLYYIYLLIFEKLSFDCAFQSKICDRLHVIFLTHKLLFVGGGGRRSVCRCVCSNRSAQNCFAEKDHLSPLGAQRGRVLDSIEAREKRGNSLPPTSQGDGREIHRREVP